MPRTPDAEKEPLVEKLLRERAEAEAKKAQLAKPRTKRKFAPEQPCAAPKYIPLVVWADQQFGAFAPHYNTLLRWVHEGFIQPQPVKMGMYWFVRPGAEYTPD